MKRILKILFVSWGVASLVGVAAVACIAAFSFSQSSSSRSEFASKRDVQFILNWGRVPTDQTYRVEHSYRSATSFSGDHVEAYAIRLQSFPDSLLQKDFSGPVAIWQQIPPTNSILIEAVKMGCGTVRSYGSDWFPKADDILTDRFRLSFWRIVLNNDSVTSAQILAYDRQMQILYYVSFKD